MIRVLYTLIAGGVCLLLIAAAAYSADQPLKVEVYGLEDVGQAKGPDNLPKISGSAVLPSYVLEMYWSSAPNAFGSASFPYNGGTPCVSGKWWDNAEWSIRTGLSSCGTGTVAYADSTGDTVDVRRATVTCFNSWDGSITDPLAPGEYGERMHIMYRFYDANGGKVRLQYLKNIEIEYLYSGTVWCTFGPFSDPNDTIAPCGGLDFSSATTFVPNRRIGYDGSTRITSGDTDPAGSSYTAGVDTIIGSFGLAFEPDCCPISACAGTQAEVDHLIGQLFHYLDYFEAKVTIDDGTNPTQDVSAIVYFQQPIVPAFTSYGYFALPALVVLVGAGILLFRRKKTAHI
ncbi:MAG: hypothetical protein A2142_05325 [candidate division Zixibacteria bacterium RBG_16_48_11]|nr:MAG: hypothetical protein A2142_05325 [candidate division Zixibacteria bacterium RBG_16_48_11]